MIYPHELKYDREHEWIRVEGDVATIGVTHFAQDQLGEVVYVDLPTTGTVLAVGDVFGEIESVKSVSELYTPVDGEVVDVNTALHDAPENVNADPYGSGWMIRVRMSDPSQVDVLLSHDEYHSFVVKGS